MSYPKPHLNAARRRGRKRTLARRDGRHCTYCRMPFTADLRNATLDHVIPISLFRTWSAGNLVLACRPCNTAKADRLPLSIALLLCAQSADRERPAHDREHPTEGREHSTDAVHEQPTDTVHEQSIGAVGEQARERAGAAFTLDWSLLARLAAINQTALTSVTTRVTPGVTPRSIRGTGSADSIDAQSTPALHESTTQPPCRRVEKDRRSQPKCPPVQPDCLRTPRPVRVCARPTGEAVPA